MSATWFLDCTMADDYSNRRAEMACKLLVDGETRKMGKRRTAHRIERPQEPTGWKVVYPGMMVNRVRLTALGVVAPGRSPVA